MVSLSFNVRVPARVTARKAQDDQKENQTSTQRRKLKHLKASCFKAPGEASKHASQKPSKKVEPREDKMNPRSGPGGPGSGPRGLKTRAAQRRSQSGLGGHLGPTWRPRGPRSPSGLHFRNFHRLLRSVPGSKRKRKSQAQAQAQSASAGPRAKDSRQQGRQASRTRGPSGMCGAP